METFVAQETSAVPSPAVELSKKIEAARAALRRGWHIFACPPNTKETYRGSHGFKDATNDEQRALYRWNQGIPANPAVYLKASNLVVLDIDAGLFSTEHALDFAKRVLGTETLIVKTRARGYHFYFSGSRTLPDVTKGGYIVKGSNISGEIKQNGYTLCPGASIDGAEYQIVHDVPVAPLPDVLRDYGVEKKTKAPKPEKAPRYVVPATIPAPVDVTGPKVWKGCRHKWLVSKASDLRKLGGSVDGITAMLIDLAINRCEDGAEYARTRAHKIRDIAEWAVDTIGFAKIRHKGEPTPRPALVEELDRLVPVSTSSVASKILSNVTTVDTRSNAGKLALARARKALGITTYREKGVRLWFRPAPKSPDEALPSVPSVRSIPSTSVDTKRILVAPVKDYKPIQMTHTTVDTVDTVDNRASVSTNPVANDTTTVDTQVYTKGSRTVYWREHKRKQRALLKKTRRGGKR